MIGSLATRAARRSLLAYCELTYPGYQSPPHLREIAEHLEGALHGTSSRRLLIVQPFRHGKSMLCSARLPAWWLGHRPRAEILHASRGRDLVETWGRETRNLLRTPEHGAVFPDCELSRDSRSVYRFHTTKGGVYFAVGVGSQALGRGGDLLIIDDPHKGVDDVDQDDNRELVWEWYRSILYSRLYEQSTIVVVSTRWHADDLVGRLLALQEDGGDQWTLLHYPAVNERGEALWPERFSLERLKAIRRNVGERTWQAGYQGRPAGMGGLLLSSDALIAGPVPDREELAIFGSSHYPISMEQSAAHVILGVEASGRCWLLDAWRGPGGARTWAAELRRLVDEYQPLAWIEDRDQLRGLEEVHRLVAREHGRWSGRVDLPIPRDPNERSRPLQAQIEGAGLGSTQELRNDMRSQASLYPVGAEQDLVGALIVGAYVLPVMRRGAAAWSAPRAAGVSGWGVHSERAPGHFEVGLTMDQLRGAAPAPRTLIPRGDGTIDIPGSAEALGSPVTRDRVLRRGVGPGRSGA
ncbi:MAG: hypothetical protein OXH38_11825 [Chloroflexi bacterium]|nr:hypothetical protein [Chloroflexota bacterium]